MGLNQSEWSAVTVFGLFGIGIGSVLETIRWRRRVIRGSMGVCGVSVVGQLMTRFCAVKYDNSLVITNGLYDERRERIEPSDRSSNERSERGENERLE